MIENERRIRAQMGTPLPRVSEEERQRRQAEAERKSAARAERQGRVSEALRKVTSPFEIVVVCLALGLRRDPYHDDHRIDDEVKAEYDRHKTGLAQPGRVVSEFLACAKRRGVTPNDSVIPVHTNWRGKSKDMPPEPVWTIPFAHGLLNTRWPDGCKVYIWPNGEWTVRRPESGGDTSSVKPQTFGVDELLYLGTLLGIVRLASGGYSGIGDMSQRSRLRPVFDLVDNAL